MIILWMDQTKPGQIRQRDLVKAELTRSLRLPTDYRLDLDATLRLLPTMSSIILMLSCRT